MAYKNELIEIAKAYCRENGYHYLFVNETDSTFGYETEDGIMVHKSFWTMAEELGQVKGNSN